MISLDMWPISINACLAQVPDAAEKVVFNRFHITQYVGQGVDRVHKQEYKALSCHGDDILARSKYLWLYSAENIAVSARARQRFDQIKHSTHL